MVRLPPVSTRTDTLFPSTAALPIFLPPHRVVVRPTRRLDNEPLALVAYAFGRESHCPASFDDLAASPHPIRSRSLSASPAVHFWPHRARSAFSNGGGSGSRIILAPLPPNGGGPGF